MPIARIAGGGTRSPRLNLAPLPGAGTGLTSCNRSLPVGAGLGHSAPVHGENADCSSVAARGLGGPGRRVGKNRRIGRGKGRSAGIGSLYSAFPVMLMTMSPETFFPFSVVGN